MKEINFLNTAKLNDEIKKMFMKEKYNIVIFSPYINISDELINILSSSLYASIVIFYRECDNISYYENKLPKVEFHVINDLHAKIYMSTSHIIITSLNLYEYSQKNNFESGIIFSNKHFSEMYDQICVELKGLLIKNNYDEEIIDEIAIYKHGSFYNIRHLYKDLMKKYGLDYDKVDQNKTNEYFHLVCEKMLDEYKNKFKNKDYYSRDDYDFLRRDVKISKEMYRYGMKNIELKK